MKKRLLLLFTISLGLFSCGSETEVNIGTEFKIEENPIKIVQLSSMENIINHENKSMKSAPEGQQYIYFEVENKNNKMIFLSAFSEGEELEDVNSTMYGYGHGLKSGYNDAYFLVDANKAITKIRISTPNEDNFIVNNPKTERLTSAAISPKMKAFIKSFKKEGVHLIDGAFSKFTARNAYTLVKEVNEATPTNILCISAKVSYIYPNGKSYDCLIQNIFGGKILANITWNNNKIVKATIQDI